MANDQPPFAYDPRTNQYRHVPSGRFVPAASVRAAVDQVINDAASSVQGLTESLRAGSIGVAEWRAGMEGTLKVAHVAAGLAAAGGTAQASPALLGYLGSQIKTQYAALDRMAAQIVSGRQPLDGTVTSRAQLYAKAARATHRAVESRAAVHGGKSEAMSVLGGMDHCWQCLSEANRGWQPIGDLIPVGSRVCLGNCRCHFIYRDAAAAQSDVAA